MFYIVLCLSNDSCYYNIKAGALPTGALPVKLVGPPCASGIVIVWS
jgi:hypothetical protein